MPRSKDLVLAADVGGTHVRLGIVSLRPRPRILLADRSRTVEITDFPAHIREFLGRAKDDGFLVLQACLAVAGPVEERKGRRRVVMSNARLVIDETTLRKRSGLRHALIINDFEALGHAIAILRKKDVKVLRARHSKRTGETMAVVGPGSGLGKSILIYDAKLKRSVPLQSEGGHADLPLFTSMDIALAQFVRDEEHMSEDSPVSYEHVLSGPGLERLYRFLRYINTEEFRSFPARLTAPEISETRNWNACSAATLDLFVRLLARCCRNFVLETYAVGGLYVAGGIVAKNPDAFGRFLEEFSRYPNPKYAKLLGAVPVTLIINPDVSLLGAAKAFSCSF